MLSNGSLCTWGSNGYGEPGTRRFTAPALSPLTFTPPTGVSYVELATGGQTPSHRWTHSSSTARPTLSWLRSRGFLTRFRDTSEAATIVERQMVVRTVKEILVGPERVCDQALDPFRGRGNRHHPTLRSGVRDGCWRPAPLVGLRVSESNAAFRRDMSGSAPSVVDLTRLQDSRRVALRPRTCSLHRAS